MTDTRQPWAWCLPCRQWVAMQAWETAKTKRGRLSYRGECPSCGLPVVANGTRDNPPQRKLRRNALEDDALPVRETPLSACPRCGTRLYNTSFDEPTCLHCGFVDYAFHATVPWIERMKGTSIPKPRRRYADQP